MPVPRCWRAPVTACPTSALRVAQRYSAPCSERQRGLPVTEYEYADLFASFLSAQNAVFANFMTVVTGMLVASWLIAPKLGRATAGIFLFIYSLWAVNLIFAMMGAFGDFTRLGLEIARVTTCPDTTLGWLGPVFQGHDMMATMYYAVIAAALLAYIASVVFFFLVRKRSIQ